MLEFPFLLVNRILSKFSLSDLSKKTETIPITLNRTRNREAPFTERERESAMHLEIEVQRFLTNNS